MMELKTIVFVIMEVVASFYLWRLQWNNWERARHALEEVKQILELPEFNPRVVTVSETLLDKFDRKIELPLEKIRSYSNAALVTGIGGTMALFFLEACLIGIYVVPSASFEFPPYWSIFLGLILALLSSLIGVIFHLRITSEILSNAHDEVSSKEVEFSEAQALAQEKSPETELGKQLEELTKAWSEAEAVDLFEMIPQFLEGQTKVMQKMQDRFEMEQSTTLKVIQNQNELTRKIEGILAVLNESNRVQQVIATGIQESQKSQLETVSDYLERLVSERESLTREIEHLPENIKNSLDVETINEIFGKQAQRYVERMGADFLGIIGDLKSDMEKNQRRLSARLASENDRITLFFDDLQNQIVNNVVYPLHKVADQLGETTGAIPKFGEDLLKSAKAISGIPEKLEGVGKNINDVVSSTATEALTPVSKEMQSYIYTVNETHRRLEKIIQGLVELIRDIVHDIEGNKS